MKSSTPSRARELRWSRKPSVALAWLCLLQLGASSPAWAQSASEGSASPVAQQAHQHFGLGVKLYAEGDYGPALAQFQRAYSLKPHVKVLYNIAQCSFQLRDYVQARAALRRYIAEGGADGLDPERRARLDADLADLGRRIARVNVASNVRGATVYVDGLKVGTTPLPEAIEISEGQRSVSVESSERGSKQRSILLVGGERQTITIDFEDSRSSSARASRVASLPLPESEPGLGAGFWLAGVGAAALGAGAGVTGYLALRAQNERRSELNRLGVTAAELNADSHQIRTLATTSDALLAGAIVCTGVATTLFLLRETAHRPGVAVGLGRVAVLGSF